MIYRLIFVVSVLSGMATSAYSQYDAKNIDKYWYYRNRLIQYHLVIGDGVGESIPFTTRNKNWNNDPPHPGGDELASGESGIIMGKYIGVLATEYRLLKNHNENTDHVIMELYYAINAINRLDYYAEVSYAMTNSLDGFFIRNDIPIDFIAQNNDHLNKRLTQGNSDWIPGTGKPSWVVDRGTIDLNPDGTVRGPLGMSQDQMLGLLTGLKLVEASLDGFENYEGRSFLTSTNNSIKTEAIKIMERFRDKCVDDDFVLEDPNGNAVGERLFGHPTTYTDNTGNMLAWSWGFSRIFPPSLASYTHWAVLQNAHVWELMPFYSSLNGFCLDFLWCDSRDNIRMTLEIAALSDSWGLATQIHILAISDFLDWGSFYSSLHHYLYGYLHMFQHGTIEEQLNNAGCTGTYFHGPNDYAGGGWAGVRKFAATPEVQNGGHQPSAGNSSGLDFMLLHNLYLLIADNADSDFRRLPYFENRLDYKEKHVYPYTYFEIGATFPFVPYAATIGNATNVRKAHSFRYITSTKEINPGAHIIYRAGEEINLKTGFHCKSGTEVHCLIKPLECLNDGTYGKGAEDGDLYASTDNFKRSSNNPKIEDRPRPDVNYNEQGVLSVVPMVISPIPNKGQFTLSIGEMRSNSSIQIIDVTGRIIYNWTGDIHYEKEIRLENQYKGLFLLKLKSESGEEVQKILVN